MASPLGQMLMAAQSAGTPTTPFRATVQPTNVIGAYNDYNNAMMQAYAAQVGQQNSLFGGLAGLGSAGIAVAPKLLAGAGGTAAVGGEGSSALASALGLGSGISDADLLASLALV